MHYKGGGGADGCFNRAWSAVSGLPIQLMHYIREEREEWEGLALKYSIDNRAH